MSPRPPLSKDYHIMPQRIISSNGQSNHRARRIARNGTRINEQPQLPPHNRDAEQSILGAMLRDNSTISPVLRIVRKEHFHLDAHQKVFAGIVTLHERGDPVDAVILAQLLTDRGHIEDIGGHGYLGDLLTASPTAANVTHHARIVLCEYRRRSVLRAAERIRDWAIRPIDHSSRLIEMAMEEIAAIGGPATDASGPALDEIDATELLREGEHEHLDYLSFLGQDGYMVRGWSHLIAGYPRTGKTELVTACCRDWLALGERLVYLTEEPHSIWRHRLSRAPVATWAGLQLVFGLGASPLDLLARARDGEESIVVVDAIRNLGLVGEDENDNTALARHLTPWVRAMRDRRKTLVLMHHDRKGGGAHGEGIAGGHALLGAVDIALELLHDSAPGRRLIRASARIIQPAELMYERQEDGTLHAIGSPDSVGFEEVRRRVREALENDWLKTAEIREHLSEPKPSAEQVRKALLAEAEAGTAERDPSLDKETKGKTVLWRRRQT